MNSNSQKQAVRRRWVRPVVLVLIAVVPLVAGWAFVVSARGAPYDDGWLLRALTSPLAIRCGLVLWASAVLLVVLGSVMWRAGAAGRARPQRGQDGAVILEFAMCLPFMLMLVLLLVQSSMLMGGNICVHNAAYLAARSAIVQIPSYGDCFVPQRFDPAFQVHFPSLNRKGFRTEVPEAFITIDRSRKPVGS